MINPFPTTIREGVTTEVNVTSDETPLKMTANSAGTVINLTAADNGDGTHTFTFEAATDYTAGDYQFNVFYEDVADKFVILGGRFKMLPSLESGDPRSQAEIILDAICAALLNRASAIQRSVQVGDKQIQYLTTAELLSAKSAYQDMVDDEQSELDGVNRQQYYAEFKNA